MKKITIAKKITTVFLLLMMLTAASGVRAQCSRLKFAKGRTTAVINGKVDKSKHACYDLHARDGYYSTPYPGVYGHEGAGIVRAVGTAVRRFAPGDHVVMSYPWCGSCPNCREHR